MDKIKIDLLGRDRYEQLDSIKDILSYLESTNFHERDKFVEFIEDDHKYLIDGVPIKYSCTGLISSYFPPFEKNKVIDNILASEKYQTGKSEYSGLDREEILIEWDKRRDLGTKLHAYIEFLINSRQKGIDRKEEDNIYDMNIDDIKIELNQFNSFYEKYGSILNFHRTEWIIYNKDINLAGSIDAIACCDTDLKIEDSININIFNSDESPEFKDGEKRYYLFDWKRTPKSLNTNVPGNFQFKIGKTTLKACDGVKYSLQLNVYRKMLDMKYGIKIGGMFLVALHPKYKTYKIYNVPFLDKVAETLIVKGPKK